MMKQCLFFALFVIWRLISPSTVLGGANTNGVSDIQTAYDRLLTLEEAWRTSHDALYFSKAVELFRQVGFVVTNATVGYHTFRLDLASGVLLKSSDAFEYGANDSSVRHCQATIVRDLATVDVDRMKELSVWPDLRARYARLLMLQRATWIRLRDPSLDGIPLVLDSTEGVKPAGETEDLLRRNRRVLLQGHIVRFLGENGPAIDRFMTRAFSIEPADFRMLNELLAIGLYSPSDRAKMVGMAAKNMAGLPDILKDQLP